MLASYQVASRPSATIRALPTPLQDRPLVYAHRGGAALRPENTLAAFDHGLALGADGLELDVHLSRDGIVMVHHDADLDRTTDGRGPLAARTAAALGALDAACHFGSGGTFPFRGQGIGIPTLGAVLARYPQVPLIVELKGPDPVLARSAVDTVGAAGALDRVVFGSFYASAVQAVRRHHPRARTGAASGEARWALYRSWVRWPLGRTPYREFQVPERAGTTTIVTPRFIAHAHRAGVAVKVCTVDRQADIDRLVDWGVDAIISDRPDVAVPAVAAKYPRMPFERPR
jgi:glycerophosphoryl diester phosphodiesterase